MALKWSSVCSLCCYKTYSLISSLSTNKLKCLVKFVTICLIIFVSCIEMVANVWFLFSFRCSISYELKKEARACFLQHVNIVALLAIIFELGHYGIVMEYVLHGALNDFIFIYDVCCLVSNLFKLCAHILKL